MKLSLAVQQFSRKAKQHGPSPRQARAGAFHIKKTGPSRLESTRGKGLLYKGFRWGDPGQPDGGPPAHMFLVFLRTTRGGGGCAASASLASRPHD